MLCMYVSIFEWKIYNINWNTKPITPLLWHGLRNYTNYNHCFEQKTCNYMNSKHKKGLINNTQTIKVCYTILPGKCDYTWQCKELSAYGKHACRIWGLFDNNLCEHFDNNCEINFAVLGNIKVQNFESIN